jgi:hypothetical protein
MKTTTTTTTTATNYSEQKNPSSGATAPTATNRTAVADAVEEATPTRTERKDASPLSIKIGSLHRTSPSHNNKTNNIMDCSSTANLSFTAGDDSNSNEESASKMADNSNDAKQLEYSCHRSAEDDEDEDDAEDHHHDEHDDVFYGKEGEVESSSSSDDGLDNDEETAAGSAAAADIDAANAGNGGGENQLGLARTETTAVRWLRGALIAVLLCGAGAVSAGLYLLTSRSELHDFHAAFDGYGQQIVDAVQMHAQNKLEASGALALDCQIHAILSNSTWPNVTVPYFEERVTATKSLTQAFGVLLFPIVTEADRVGWEEYSVQHRDWIWDSYATQRHVYGVDQSRLSPVQLEPGNRGKVNWWDHLWGSEYLDPANPDFSSGISSSIMTTEHVDDPNNYDPVYDKATGPGSVYYPQWQAAPMSWYYQTTVNSNYGHFSDFLEQTRIVNNTGHAVFGMAWSDSKAPGYISTMLYPIFNQFYSNTSTVVAFLAIDIFWFVILLFPRVLIFRLLQLRFPADWLRLSFPSFCCF